PRRPSGDPSPRRGDDEAIVFDSRRGRRGSEEDGARAIPTGKRERPARSRPSGSAQRPGSQRRSDASRPDEEPRTRVMPVGTPPSRPASEDPRGEGGGPRRPSRPGPGGPGGPGGRQPGRTRRRRPGRMILTVLLVLALAWAGGMIWA